MRGLIIVLLASIAFVGCDPYHYTMGEAGYIGVTIRSPLNTVKKGKVITTLRDTGMISFSRYGVTQYRTRFFLRLDEGEGALLSARGVVRDEIVDRGITVRFDRGGITIDSSGKKLMDRPGLGFAQDSLLEVHVYSDAHIFQVVANCDTLVRTKQLHSLEPDEMLLQALPDSRVSLINPVWDYQPWFNGGDF
jgi:hypothetical protein